ncbi:MAG: hypothetical protein AAFZ06_14650, partial [Pseudomonadota bacterium]
VSERRHRVKPQPSASQMQRPRPNKRRRPGRTPGLRCWSFILEQVALKLHRLNAVSSSRTGAVQVALDIAFGEARRGAIFGDFDGTSVYYFTIW